LDHPWDEVIKTATGQIEKGNDVYQKFTCANCGSRQTMETPNVFYTEGKCEECGHVTDIKKNGMNYMLIMHAKT
jgi:predicted RNA-binding Zn-ribbon protein involved in translation (DUF1610 family)